jgi:hypothetical protein
MDVFDCPSPVQNGGTVPSVGFWDGRRARPGHQLGKWQHRLVFGWECKPEPLHLSSYLERCGISGEAAHGLICVDGILQRRKYSMSPSFCIDSPCRRTCQCHITHCCLAPSCSCCPLQACTWGQEDRRWACLVWVLKFNKYCSTFVLFDKKFLILD